MTQRNLRSWQDFVAGLINRIDLADEKGFTAYLTARDKVQLQDLHHEMLQMEIRARRDALSELRRSTNPSSSRR